VNPHPPLAGFPFVMLCCVVFAELLAAFYRPKQCRKFAAVLLRALCVVAPLTYYAGYWGAEMANQTFSVSIDVIAAHQMKAKMLLLSLIPTLLLSILERQASEADEPFRLRVLYYFFLLVSFALVILTSYEGGDLVFIHGAGVSAR